jgi:Tfp pilus assembly protein PilF
MDTIERLVGAGLAVLVMVVYAGTCSVGAYPGESARELTRCLGILPAIAPDGPIWRWTAGAIGALAGAKAVAALNGFAVFCGAFAVWLMYRVVSLGLRLAISAREVEGTRAWMAAVLGGAVAALFLAFCVPFWVCGTRATPAAFHVVMLLGATSLFLAWWRDGRGWQLLIFWSICGLGVVEFATFVLFVPLFAGFTVYRLWQTELLTVRRVVAVGCAGVCPLLLYAVAAGVFVGSAGYELRGYESYGQVVWFWWRDQYMLLRYGLPQVGWLLIVTLTVVPWVSVLVVGRHALNRTPDSGLLVLHAVLTGIAMVLLFNLKISPWRLVGWGQMLVTPYVLAACVCGYLAAYASLLPQAWWSRDVTASPPLQRRRDGLGALLAASFLAVVIVAPFRNAPEADGRAAAFVNAMAHETVEALGPREWLVTDGLMDANVLLAARERGKDLKTINMFDRSDTYVRLLARRFEKPAYRNVLQVSTAAFVKEWMEGDPAGADMIAVQSDPDLWLAAHYAAVPARLLYVGMPRGATNAVALSGALKDHRAFWADVRARPARAIRQPADWVEARLVRHIGAVANNFGVFLEDAGRTNDAFAVYQAARLIDPENLSALLNMGVMLDRGFETAEKSAIRSDLDTLQRTVKQRMHAWTLARHYGYVRIPELYAQIGWNWVLSGQPGLGVSRLLKAIELTADPARAQLAQQALAYAYLAQNEQESSEAVCQAILQRDPANVGALVAMARIELRKRNARVAASYLDRAEKAGAPLRNLAFDWVGVHLTAGDTAKARVILERLVDEDPNLTRGWAMLAGIHAQEKDAQGLDRCLDRLDAMRDGRGVAALVRGQVAMERMDMATARRNLDIAHTAMPAHIGVIEKLVKLDLIQSKQDMARTHALELLRLRPNHGLGNYVIGSIQLVEGKLDLAEDSLRRSMAVEKTPAVLNDLAWVLCKRARYPEAEEMARAALAMRSDMYQAWDTLGVILMKAGRLEDSDEALRKSLGLFADDPVVHLHMVELHLLRGDRDAARQAIAAIKDKRDFLPLEDKMRFDELSLSLKAGRP